MPRIEIAGLGIEYDLVGSEGAHAVALVPGGRFSKDISGIPEFAQKLAAGGKRVLLWDRPNCGQSDFSLDGESEAQLHAEVLTQLIRALDLGPTAVGGGSAGSRVALLAAAHDPEVVSHLLLWWLSGGILSLTTLGASYCSEPAIAASMGGMQAVLGTQLWAGQIKTNPTYRDILLGVEPKVFIKAMERWAAAFVPREDSPVASLSPEAFGALKMPTMIVRGSPTDLYHPDWVSEWVQRLIPQSLMVEAPWPDDSFLRCMTQGAQTGSGHFADWLLLAPQILEFTGKDTTPPRL